MQLLSVNIGTAEAIASKSGLSGINKRPQNAPVLINTLGLAGDTIVDTKHHGGPDQAVYIYFQKDYAWWEQTLHRPLAAGTFGENLTLDEAQSDQMHIGDKFIIGPVELEITSPRIPCTSLAAIMNDLEFPKKFLTAKRPGVYCRVLKGGKVRQGAEVIHHPYPGPKAPVNLMLPGSTPLSPAEIDLLLQTPVHHAFRQDQE